MKNNNFLKCLALLAIILLPFGITLKAAEEPISQSDMSVSINYSTGEVVFDYVFESVQTNDANHYYRADAFTIEYRHGNTGTWKRLMQNFATTPDPFFLGNHRVRKTLSAVTYYPATSGNDIRRGTVKTHPENFNHFLDSSTTFRVQFTWQQYRNNSTVRAGNSSDKVWNYTVSRSFGAVQSLGSNLEEYCDKVRLTWQDGTGTNNLSNTRVAIFRKEFGSNASPTLLADSLTSKFYDDTTAIPGVKYNYLVKNYLEYIYNNSRLANPVVEDRFYPGSDSIEGKKFGPPSKPSGLFLDQANCNGDIDVNWNWQSSVSAENFIIVRADDSLFTVNSDTAIVSGGDRDFRDSDPVPRSRYYYKIVAMNTCPVDTALKLFSKATKVEAGYGSGTPLPTIVSGLIIDTVQKAVTIQWVDNSFIEDGFKVLREGDGTQVEFDANADTTSYTDKSASVCVNYTYKVKTYNTCKTNGVVSRNDTVVALPADVGVTFNSTNGMEASDGEFGDRIELKWTTDNRQNEDWKISRIDPSIPDTIQIASVDGKQKRYIDNTANANTFYEYNIYGETDCAGNIVQSNSSKDYGFKLAYGTVNGQVTYAGGTAVKGVKISAKAASGVSGKSLNFSSTAIRKVEVKPNSKFNTRNFSVQAFVMPTDSVAELPIINKPDSVSGGWQFLLDGNKLVLRKGTNVLLAERIPYFRLSNWTSVGFIVDTDSVHLFANGVNIKSIADSSASYNSHNKKLFIGHKDWDGSGTSTTNFNGRMDEVRFFNRAISPLEFKQSFDVYINPSMAGLAGYWRFDEGFGSIAYDYSRTNLTSNRNHGTITNAVFDSNIPTSTQLTAGAYTDSLGSYFIPFIPYQGTGDNFIISPTFGIHTFDPATTTLFVGGTNPNHTGVNFNDKSSFKVRGSVKYKGTSCFVEDVLVKIDGEVQVQFGRPVSTGDSGTFAVSVPIGRHVVSVEKNGHVFSLGSFPKNGDFDFQDSINLSPFIDSTLIKVIGRVAGGGEQATLVPGVGRGNNNIGEATIFFTAKNGGCIVKTARTSVSTGEYSVSLPPMLYDIADFTPTSNPTVRFENNTVLDLSLNPGLETIVDTLFTTSNGVTQIVQIDTVEYNVHRDFIYYNMPTVGVSDAFGEDSVAFEEAGVQTFIPADAVNSNYPIFIENREYTWNITAFEEYTNLDIANDPVIDSVPVKEGVISITNNLGTLVNRRFEIEPSEDFNGNLEFIFSAGQARTTTDIVAENNFTKTFDLVLTTPNHSVSWKPNENNNIAGDEFRGIILGGRALGNSFATAGPQVVTMILRDPPGSQSFASWESGRSVTTTNSWSNEVAAGARVNSKISLGVAFSVGLGYSTKTKITNSVLNNVESETSVNTQGEHVTTVTRTQTLSTSDDPDNVGSSADLYFGRSMNMDFGLAEVIGLIKLSNCGTGNNSCSGGVITHNSQSYKLGTTRTMFVVPGGYETEFIFTEAAILNNVIPKLVNLRDQELADVSQYSSVLPTTHQHYGKSNDDPAFGNAATPEPGINSTADGTGSSYTFLGYTTENVSASVENGTSTPTPQQVQVEAGVDSVWWFNYQIKLWEDAIARNEKEKVLASNVDKSNISYSGGAVYTNSTTTSRDTTSSTLINFSLSNEMAAKIGANLGGVGVSVETGVTLRYNHNTTTSTTNNTTTSFSFTIQDNDSDDSYTFDTYKPKDGFGTVFKLRAGETSCPYQGEEKTKFYNPGAIINPATVKLEQPGISVSPSEVLNVPADASANLTLTLSNAGPKDAIYSLRVLESTNPNGAIIKIDGIDPNRDFAVPGGASINKTLTVEKGPGHIRFENIGLVFHSTCQYSFGTNLQEDIADTVYFTVNYLPSCTSIDILDPSNQFVFNNSYTDEKLTINISGYDINYDGLDKIGLQYKPASRASWSTISTEWFKNLANGGTSHPDSQLIPRGLPFITYDLDLSQDDDQDYNIRVFSSCKINGYPDKVEYSDVITGVADRVDPHPFGLPTPADGVLDPNDAISIRFNEPIKSGSLTSENFQITGVVNGQEILHSKAIAFDGANDFLEIQNGFEFSNSDFTVEFWAKRNELGRKQVILSQGSSASNFFEVGFAANNRLLVQLGNQKDSSDFLVLDDSTWNHYSVSYHHSNGNLELTYRTTTNNSSYVNNSFVSTHNPGGKTLIGSSSNSSNVNFNGSLHELRIWNKYYSNTEITTRSSKGLSGREAGLIGYWKMDEGRGILAEDIARSRNATVNASWEINPKGSSVLLDGISNYLELSNASSFSLSNESDLTVEFWFKTAGGRDQTLFSNGSGMEDSADVNDEGWSIGMTAANKIVVWNNGQAFEAVSSNFADNNWHHFALVVNRLTNTTGFIDGIEQNTVSSDVFDGFGGDRFTLGCRTFNNGSSIFYDRYFSGQMDEFRIWNSAKTREAIELEQYSRLSGNEFGLFSYYPFETQVETQAGPQLVSSFKSGIVDTVHALSSNGAQFSNSTPAISLPRQTKLIFSTFSVNSDEIVITPSESPSRIENVTLKISVKDVKDLHGNTMQSTKSWIAYVNKNQVLWQDAQKGLTKELNDTLSFVTTIVNQGGEVKNYTISNVPSWLTTTSTSGTIGPLSNKTVRFTVNPGINIGEFVEDLILTTDFGFNEKLQVRLKVKKTPPSFTFNSNQYQNSMSIMGQIRINGSISNNEDDYLIAYSGTEIRGFAKLQYIASFDKYFAFLDVYSNSSDSIQFQVWNAAKGELHVDVTPNITFQSNAILGSLNNPQYFDAEDKLKIRIPLQAGWNWVSFPLSDPNMKSISTFLSFLYFSDGDVIKTRGTNGFAQYGGPSFGWIGELTRNGLTNNQSYLIRISQLDTLEYRGFELNPDTMPINVASGWNRVGFVSTKNMQINTALANFNATGGDLIKSQQNFAVYVPNLGWVGSLTTMEPTQGYLLKAANAGTFTYPRRGLFRLKAPAEQEQLSAILPTDYSLNPNDFETSTSAIIKINTCEEVLTDSTWSLVAFRDNEVRGYSKSTIKVDDVIGSEYFMTVYGSGNETYRFEMVNAITKEKMKVIGQISFEKDKLQGEVNNPLRFDLIQQIDCDQFKKVEDLPLMENLTGASYPNPFSDFLTILVPVEISEDGKVQILDQNGRLVFEQNVTSNKKIFLNGAQLYKFSNGVYQLKFTDGETVITEKLVKME